MQDRIEHEHINVAQGLEAVNPEAKATQQPNKPRSWRYKDDKGPDLMRSGGDKQAQGKRRPLVRRLPKIGRNEPCPCQSGIKFKKCCVNNAGFILKLKKSVRENASFERTKKEIAEGKNGAL